MRIYSDWLSGKLFALASDDPEVRRRTLAWCEDAWVALGRAQESATDCSAGEILKEAMWHETRWAIEIMVGLSEANFALVPADIMSEISAAARCFGVSKPAEDLFSFLKGQTRDHPSGRLGRMARWRRSTCSNILADRDRRELQPDFECRNEARHLPTARRRTFCAASNNFSLGAEVVSEYRGKTTWHSPSQQHYFWSPCAWQAIQKFSHKLEELRTLWLSNMVPDGCMIFHQMESAMKAFWVLNATPMASLRWRRSRSRRSTETSSSWHRSAQASACGSSCSSWTRTFGQPIR